MKFDLDAYDRKILALLQDHARMSYTEIGRRIHLTSPAVGERVKRLEEAGVIEGYGARVNLRALGYNFEAFINVVVDSHEALDAWALGRPEVLALHATTGTFCALLRVAARSPEHLQEVIASLGKLGKTTTSIVLSTSHAHRARVPAQDG
ncbi:Lrp/AsnC family transcriptional regulator [Massilia sp. PAMC28688]|uniref:Lrp/AsnC family transcriptional regulator n=1 Tax=Massilia sp. PAMC28688 TaxID=2861283 RepID=UPI001E4EA07D|nr:Lrp/AsnC family transcriptional regulator [Massilia sp. PAMC28688]